MYGSCNASILLLKCIQIAALLVFSLLACSCGEEQRHNDPPAKKNDPYLGHSPDARYVGMGTCRKCHDDIYQSFVRTGMGQSFALATRSKSAADFSKATLYDRFSNFSYTALWKNDSLFIKEYRLQGTDTIHNRTELVNFIIGSGQHTNSHMQSVNGYVHQMPMTFYTQQKRWDLPPGFEDGMNTRFSRKIGLECMTCHNAYPEFVMGSENKFVSIPQGIDCERCHGPGNFHVEQRTSAEAVDTSRFVDYSIVNPAKLSVERQFDICQRCHLQGNAVLKEGRSFFDFKPGLVLDEYVSVFMPRYKNGEDEFIMASHAERLKMSQCFIQSLRKVDTTALRPYKKAMTCVTCHNPHVSVKETSNEVFNQACQNCHNSRVTLEEKHRTVKKWENCVSCHMPRSGSSDIPHVTVHDHFIRKPVNKEQKKAIAEFLGLYSVNEKHPDALTRARAYLDQYEKFKQDPSFLDSAETILRTIENKKAIRPLIQLYFVRRQYPRILELIIKEGEQKCIDSVFVKKSFDNADAWALYRVGEAFIFKKDVVSALKWYEHATQLSPFNLDFRNKLGVTYLAAGKSDKANEEFEFILREDPTYVSAYSNLGYMRMLSGNNLEARRLLLKGKMLDPDNEQLLLNLASCHIQLFEKKEAIVVLETIIRKNASNARARAALNALNRK
jgi:tetratricopeptide (TPR) repeat protein